MISRRVFRFLLWLLPPRRRTRFSDEMVEVFDGLRRIEQQQRGRAGLIGLWLRELAGLTRFVAREWFTAAAAALGLGRHSSLGAELRWAQRGIRSRGWSAVFTVGLLAVTIAVNVATFAMADSLVFHRHPYADVNRIVALDQFVGPDRRPGRQPSAALLTAWADQHDLFAAAGGFLEKGGVFRIGGNRTERLNVIDATVGMLDVLGARPARGRTFSTDDLQSSAEHAVLLSDRRAREWFGSADSALGRRIEATGGPLIVVGVMPPAFAFPSASVDLWRAMDPAGPLTAGFGGLRTIARVAPGVPLDELDARVQAAIEAVGSGAGIELHRVAVTPYFADSASSTDERKTLLLLLFGAGAALLLASAANVMSVELTHAVRRSHASAVQLALGGSRASLARIAVAETTMLAVSGVAGSLVLASWLLSTGDAALPDALRLGTQNPFDLDRRTLAFSLGAGVVVWAVLSIAAAVARTRPMTLSASARAMSGPPAQARVRRALTALQVSAAVALVIVGAMYSRSYQALLDVEKGFESSGLVVVSTEMPAHYFGDGASRAAFNERLLETVRAIPGVNGATNASPPPHLGDSPMQIELVVDGDARGDVLLGRKWVDTEFFGVIGLPLVSGRVLRDDDPPTAVVVSDAFARRLSPDGHAVGRTFRGGNAFFREPSTVVGVVKDFRTDARRMPRSDDGRMFVYSLAPRVAATLRPPSTVGDPADSGGSYAGASVTARVDSPAVLPAVRTAVQQVDPQLAVTLEIVDDTYARKNDETRLAAQIVGVFGGVSFLVAMAGLYGVVAFMVASRTREIGIRMALGAAAGDIRRMVLASSGRMVATGSLMGATVAFGAARWIESQLFGVSPSDPRLYLVVIAGVAGVALLATWHPARQASATDPAVTLRAE